MKKAANVLWGVSIESEGIGQSPGIESLLLGHRNHSITSQVCHFSNYTNSEWLGTKAGKTKETIYFYKFGFYL
jgi:hypothetical protein